ncbi:MAG: DUF294 nucleotidyltransferase-like domain-containing protein [Caldilineaceae bacterium]
MPKISQSSTNQSTLDQVITTLAQQTIVDGLIVVGSAGRKEMTPASDYDLVLILGEMPVPLHTGVTYIDGRFTDLVFHTSEQIEQILAATTPFDFWDWTGRLVGWLLEGQVCFDRYSRVGAAQAKARNGTWLASADNQAAYGAWQRINYNLAVVRRYLSSTDPNYLVAADMRMAIYGPQDLFWNYFAVRGLPPASEKQQIHYLQQHDPAFLARFNRFLAEPNRSEKFRLYEELAAEVLAPVGRLWQDGETVLNLTAEVVTPAMEQQALSLWESLIHPQML